MNLKKSFRFFLNYQSHIPSDVRYSLLLKKRTKHTCHLKLEEKNSKPVKCQKMLSQIVKIFKYSPNVDLSKFQGFASLELSKLQKSIKLFKNVKEIKLPDRLDNHYFDFSIMLLKQCKNLTSFASYLPAMKTIFQNKETFMKSLHRKKLKKLHFSAADNFIGIPFKKYPPTLQELSYKFKPDFLRPFLANSLEYRQPFSHLKDLKHLNLSIAAYARILSMIFASIPNPNNLESLGFFIGTVRESDLECISALTDSLQLFKNLKRLKIIFSNPEIVIDILRVLTNQPLEFLEIEAGLDDEDVLSSLAILLGSLKLLKHLVIRMKNKAEIYVPEAYILLFKHISELTQLRTFEFLFDNSEAYVKKSTGSEVLSAFCDCLSNLPHLKEVSFQILKKDFSGDLPILTQVLKQNCKNFTKLQLGLFSKKLDNNQDFTEFLQALSRMEKLEELTLSGLTAKNENLFLDLLETLYSLQNLRIITVENDVTIEKQTSFEMMIKIALKKKTEILNINNVLSVRGFKAYQNQFTFQGIQRRNPHLITFSVHPDPGYSFIPPELS